MKRLFPSFLLTLAVHAEENKTADLTKLLDPALREAEVRRIADIEEPAILTRYRFLTAKQKTGEPLFVLSAAHDRKSFRSALFGYDEVDKPEELFSGVKSSAPFSTEPDLAPIEDSVLMVFDPRGREITPFGGDNHTDNGYYYDFDRDGILDRADYNNIGLDEAPKTSITVFELRTFERGPRTLLRVIYNWHPDAADDANHWNFTCFDENHDGIPEIAFGSADTVIEKDPQSIVFRWNPEQKAFSAGNLPDHSHVRVLKAAESLESIAKSGGLGYPVIHQDPHPDSNEEKPPFQGGPYVFQSLNDQPDEMLATFFQGKERRDRWDGPEDSFPNRLPEHFTRLSPKEAALAIADANRSPTHRRIYQLAPDGRGGVRPPESGWLLHDWSSSGCYSLSTQLCALRFGVKDSRLIVFGYNTIGVVGRNPWADQPAHNIRIIPLGEHEARFIADTIFWLDRIRSFSPRKDDPTGDFGGSTADGHATTVIYPDHGKAREIASQTIWATSSISARWSKDYSKEVFANLVQLLVDHALPEMLGNRWKSVPEIGRVSLATPLEERITPRINENGRRQLIASYQAILEQHAREPMPARALVELIQSAEDEAITELLPGLRNLMSTLPPENDEDREFAALEKRFENELPRLDFLHEESGDEKQARERYEALREKREFDPPAVLRAPLAKSVSRLAMAEVPSDLMNAAADGNPDSAWALRNLRRSYPEVWAQIIASHFQKGDEESRRAMFSTLAAGHPPTARRLHENMTPGERMDLAIEIARFHLEQDRSFPAEDVLRLMSLVRDRKQDYIRRGEAMGLLAESHLSGGQLAEFANLMEQEIRNPQQGEYGMTTLDAATKALGSLPRESVHVELLVESPRVSEEVFDTGAEAIAGLAAPPKRRDAMLVDYVRPRFKTSPGMMNRIFLTALAFDLRALKEDLAAMATESPAVVDGDAANYSGGSFKGPGGQRYHIAREITALWSESDPATLARMWIFFAAAHPDAFNPQSGDTSTETALRKLAAARIRTLPSQQRLETVQHAVSLIPTPPHAAETGRWLLSLCD